MSFGAISMLLAISLAPVAAPARTKDDDARATLRAYASCIAQDEMYFRHKGKSLAAFLRVSPFAPEARSAFDKITSGYCLHYRTGLGDRYVAKIGFTPVMMRGALFRGLYQREFGSRGVIALRAENDNAAWRLSGDESFAGLQLLGECVVRRDAESARAILFAPTASADEVAAYAKVQPILGQCATVGTKLRFSRVVFEGLLAEGLYHLSGGQLAVTQIGHGDMTMNPAPGTSAISPRLFEARYQAPRRTSASSS